jgi:hypothetical protein
VTKPVPIAVAAVTLAALAACTSSPSASPPSTSPPAASPPAATPSAAPATESTTAPATTTATTPTVDPGDSRNWTGSLAACPNEGQKPQIQEVRDEDATADGALDTLIARTCEASTSYIPSTVEVFDGRKRIGTLLKDVGPTDLPWYRSMTVTTPGKVTIEAYGVSAGGLQACADLRLTYTYEFQDGGFTRTGREETKVDDLCLPVG